MSWKVLVRAENPSPGTLATLEELTGLGRGEVLLALRRTGLVVGEDFDEERARALSRTLGDLGLSCSVSPSAIPEATQFRVVLTGFRPGYRARLRETLQKLSGLPPEQIVVWLSRIPFVLKDSVDHETARQIKRILVEAGGMVDLRQTRENPAQPPAGRPAAAPASQAAPEQHPAHSIQETDPAAPRPAVPPDACSPPPEPAGASASPGDPPVDPPPCPAQDEPPLLPESRMPGQAPPALCFRWPGRSPQEPPVIPTPEDLQRIPQSSCDTPPVLSRPPSARSGSLSVYLNAVSGEAVESLLETLCERLEFRREEALALVGSPPPVRIASGQPPGKAAEIAAMLEGPGVTLSLCSTRPSRLPRESAHDGFMSWLNRNG
ncbi:MAG: hypothetical protein QUS11_08960 [Candidatus Fermentibacter sp.]|nr:hypothetical protein [Candidatus Fermentibacter sp.]